MTTQALFSTGRSRNAFIRALDAETRKYLTIIAGITAAFALIDALWLPFSPVDFPPANWLPIARGAVLFAGIWGVAEFILYRRRADRRPEASRIRNLARRLLILVGAIATLIALVVTTTIFTYLASATSRPLLDTDLASIDAMLDFDWPAFLGAVNQSAVISTVLVAAYNSLTIQGPLVLLWHAMRLRSDRAFELLAIMAVSLVFVGAILILIPAAGAYPFHNPPLEAFSNFSAPAGLRHYSALQTLRSGEPFELILAKAEGLVTFPSFHAALAIIFIYAVRDVRAVAVLFGIVNAVMIVATIPEGGHYLIDVIAGMAVAAVSIVCVRALTAERLVAVTELRSARAK